MPQTVVLAVTAQQSFAIVVALLVTLGWVLYLVANVRKAKPEIGSEIELAANRKPYYDDEGLEGPRLDRVLTWGLIGLTIVGVGLPLYWLAEPGRQAGAVDTFDEVFASRGEGLFAATADGGFNCAGCHGGLAAIGGEVQYTLTDPDTGQLRQVSWYAPSLNDVTLRMTDEQILDVLVYGRPFSPMPAWGLEGGGPMNDQQLDNLLAYMKSIAITPEAAQEQAAERAEAELAELQGGNGDQPATIGAALFNTNCARCHTLGYSYGEPQLPGAGAMGPSLYNSVNQFPAVEDQVGFVAEGAERGERYGLNGMSSGRMPYFSQVLTPEQIEAIVAYERSLSEALPGVSGDGGDGASVTGTEEPEADGTSPAQAGGTATTAGGDATTATTAGGDATTTTTGGGDTTTSTAPGGDATTSTTSEDDQ